MKIIAACSILDIKTDKVISERIIGEFDTVDQASHAAIRERKENEAVCLYNCPAEPESEMSALEMAEMEADFDYFNNF
jgi:hypothetical protein